MNQTDTMLAMIEMAKQGGEPSAEDAIAQLAAVISLLDPVSPTYEESVELLLGVGACIWKLQEG